MLQKWLALHVHGLLLPCSNRVLKSLVMSDHGPLVEFLAGGLIKKNWPLVESVRLHDLVDDDVDGAWVQGHLDRLLVLLLHSLVVNAKIVLHRFFNYLYFCVI